MQNQHFTTPSEKAHLSSATSKRDNAERGTELPATLELGSRETLVNLSTASLRLLSCSDDGAERHSQIAVEERS